MRPREVFSSIEAKTVLTLTLVQLPTLLFQSDRYKVVALCDISQQSLRHCGSRFHIPEASQFADLCVLSNCGQKTGLAEELKVPSCLRAVSPLTLWSS
jgi:hypothetical protein